VTCYRAEELCIFSGFINTAVFCSC